MKVTSWRVCLSTGLDVLLIVLASFVGLDAWADEHVTAKLHS